MERRPAAAPLMKQLLEFAVSPVGVMCLLMAAGLLATLLRRRSPLGRRLLAAGVLLFLLYTLSPLAELLISSLERHYPPLLDPDPKTSPAVLVVLAGYGVEHPSIPVTSNVSSQTLCIIAEAVRLHRRLPGSTLVTSGGVARPGHKAVAAIMADLLAEMGVPREAVTVEGRSGTTWENLAETQKILGENRFILVAAACDLPRAMAVARRLGMDAVPAPACFWALQEYPAGMSWRDFSLKVLAGFASPSLARLRYLQWAHHEYLGYLWYLALGRI